MSSETVTVPIVPKEAMWGGLARDIVMWWGSDRPTGKNLYLHLNRLGVDAPAWLRMEIHDIDHVPAKGDVAVAIWRAMIDAIPPGAEPPADAEVAPSEIEQAEAVVLATAMKRHRLSRLPWTEELGDAERRFDSACFYLDSARQRSAAAKEQG